MGAFDKMEAMSLKVRVIRDYLTGQFPENNVEAYQDGGETGPYVFRVDHGRTGAALHRAVAPCKVLDGLSGAELQNYLSSWDLAGKLREAGLRPVVVTREGLQVEGQLHRPIKLTTTP